MKGLFGKVERVGRRLFLQGRIQRLIRPAETLAPTHMALETTAFCNGRCSFCPSPALTRPRGTMPTNLFSRIIKDARRLGTLRVITHGGMGEPLLDPDIALRVAQEKRNLDARVQLHTNGSLLTTDKAEALYRAGLDVLSISVNACDARSHRIITGLDYEGILQHTREALRVRDEIGAPTRIRATLVDCDLITRKDIRRFRRQWSTVVDDVAIHPMKNWADPEANPRPGTKLPCKWVWYTISVHWDGSVGRCHEDYDESTPVGNLGESTILELFNHPKLVEIRRRFHEGHVPDLAGCPGCSRLDQDRWWWLRAARHEAEDGTVTYREEDA